MAIISCPECGKQVSDRAVSCPNCGYPISSAPAVVPQVNTSSETDRLLIYARRARESADSRNAKKYYDQILDRDPGNWEAIFYSVYFEATECKIMHISSAANSVANCIFSTFAAISDLKDDRKETEALNTVITSALVIAAMFVSSAVSHYNQYSTTDNAFSECVNRVIAAGNIYDEIEKHLKRLFPGKTSILTTHQKLYVSFLYDNRKWYNSGYMMNTTNRLTAEIRMHEPAYQPPVAPPEPAASSGCCYVATAVYGSYDCPEVWTLRRFRDDTLARTWYGRAFVRTYYAISPTLVKWFGDTRWFRKMWRGTLDRMVRDLQSKGFESTPYEDKVW